jgi:hypothetical protein
MIMARRSLALAIFAPIVVYLVAMILLAALSLHPPLLGWIGLGLVSVLALAIGAAATVLAPRMAVNAVHLHPHGEELYRLLIVAAAEADPDELRAAVELKLLGRRGEVRVVAPVTPAGLPFLTTDETQALREAERRLRGVIATLAAVQIPARGVVGADDPLQATGDLLADFEADEILLVATQAAHRHWSEQHFERRARDLFGLPVSTLSASQLGAAAA